MRELGTGTVRQHDRLLRWTTRYSLQGNQSIKYRSSQSTERHTDTGKEKPIPAQPQGTVCHRWQQTARDPSPLVPTALQNACTGSSNLNGASTKLEHGTKLGRTLCYACITKRNRSHTQKHDTNTTTYACIHWILWLGPDWSFPSYILIYIHTYACMYINGLLSPQTPHPTESDWDRMHYNICITISIRHDEVISYSFKASRIHAYYIYDIWLCMCVYSLSSHLSISPSICGLTWSSFVEFQTFP